MSGWVSEYVQGLLQTPSSSPILAEDPWLRIQQKNLFNFSDEAKEEILFNKRRDIEDSKSNKVHVQVDDKRTSYKPSGDNEEEGEMLKRALAMSLEEEDNAKEHFSTKGEQLIKIQKWRSRSIYILQIGRQGKDWIKNESEAEAFQDGFSCSFMFSQRSWRIESSRKGGYNQHQHHCHLIITKILILMRPSRWGRRRRGRPGWREMWRRGSGSWGRGGHKNGQKGQNNKREGGGTEEGIGEVKSEAEFASL